MQPIITLHHERMRPVKGFMVQFYIFYILPSIATPLLTVCSSQYISPILTTLYRGKMCSQRHRKRTWMTCYTPQIGHVSNILSRIISVQFWFCVRLGPSLSLLVCAVPCFRCNLSNMVGEASAWHFLRS